MIDPITLKIVEISSKDYWREPFRAVMTQSQLTEYVILDIEVGETGNVYNKQNAMNQKVVLAEATVARSCDLGVNDQQYVVMTHLGGILKAGDLALGYDITNTNVSDNDMKDFKGDVPDVILVKKTYPKKNRAARRKWKLRSLNKEALDRPLKKAEEEKGEQDMENFLQAIEEDPEMRNKVNLYKKDAIKSSKQEEDDDELPSIEDLLDDIKLDDKADPEDEEAIDFTK